MAVSISGDGAITGMVSADSSDLSTELDAKLDVPGAWTSFTPGVAGTGWSAGNATFDCKYSQIGKVVFYRGRIIWGSTSTFGSVGLLLDLPVAAKTIVGANIGKAIIFDASDSNRDYCAEVSCNSGSNMVVQVPQIFGNYMQRVGYSSTVPVAAASGDYLDFSLTYEAA